MRQPALLARMQSQWKLSRGLGIANLLIVHRLSDLDAVGDRDSEARALAQGLLGDCSTKIIYQQEISEAAHTASLLGLTTAERAQLPDLQRGEGLWRRRPARLRRAPRHHCRRAHPLRHQPENGGRRLILCVTHRRMSSPMVAPPASLLPMATRSRTAPQTDNLSDRRLAVAVASIAGLWMVLTAGATTSCLVLGLHPPAPAVGPPFAALAMPIHLARAWGREMPSPAAYWGTTLLIAGVAGTLAILGTRRLAGRQAAPGAFLGAASRGEAQRAAGGALLLARHQALRPSLRKPAIADLGFRLGRSQGVVCHSSVEDSVVVLGPPRSGKGLHLAVPLILDAPGAVVTTSTRPDNVAITMRARSRRGPVAVFDPQRLAPEISSTTRWSPVRGCENPHTAMVRAKALTTGTASGTTDSTFWQASAEQAVRCLLHAAALGGCTTADLYRWSLSAVQAREAVMVLASDEAAAPGWQHALDALISTDPKQRDSVWAMVTIAFGALADPTVLDALSPDPLDAFDPEMFLSSQGHRVRPRYLERSGRHLRAGRGVR